MELPCPLIMQIKSRLYTFKSPYIHTSHRPLDNTLPKGFGLQDWTVHTLATTSPGTTGLNKRDLCGRGASLLLTPQLRKDKHNKDKYKHISQIQRFLPLQLKLNTHIPDVNTCLIGQAQYYKYSIHSQCKGINSSERIRGVPQGNKETPVARHQSGGPQRVLRTRPVRQPVYA